MAIDHNQMILALRTKLAMLEVCTTGSMSLAATGATFVRTAGSFLTDGFFEGMEVVGTGFGVANNAAATVVSVTALVLTVNRTLETEVAAAARTLTVGQPAEVGRENEDFTPTPGSPHFEEQYLPGPTIQITVGDGGTIHAQPMLVIDVNVPDNLGAGALNAYTTALMRLLAPKVTMTLTNGDFLRVRTDTGPYATQTINLKSGWATRQVSFPLWLLTINS